MSAVAQFRTGFGFPVPQMRGTGTPVPQFRNGTGAPVPQFRSGFGAPVPQFRGGFGAPLTGVDDCGFDLVANSPAEYQTMLAQRNARCAAERAQYGGSGGGGASSGGGGFDIGSILKGVGEFAGSLFGGGGSTPAPAQPTAPPSVPSYPVGGYYPPPTTQAKLPTWVVPVGVGAVALVAVALIARK